MSDAENPVLRPANDNPWYCLATLHGEQPVDSFDQELADKNREAWNRWTGDMSEGARAELEEAFRLRTGGSLMPPELVANPDFSNTNFDRKVVLDRFTFARSTNFSDAKFSDRVSFGEARFSGFADFDSAAFFKNASFRAVRFSKNASFDAATFAKVANFQAVEFFGITSFRAATFSGVADFHRTKFSITANFISATFSDQVNFTSARFSGATRFVNASFAGTTMFAFARFESESPDFRGATLHEGTEWHDVNWPGPPRSKYAAQYQVYAYERLKQEMERLKKHEDEQSFFRKELRARRALVGPWSGAGLLNRAYEILSDYGNSISRPLIWPFGVFLIGVAIFARAPLYCGAPMPITLAAKLSFFNIFAFLPDRREVMTIANMVDCLSNTTQAVSAVQSLFGVILLFLFGLALRNRFRMK